MSEKQSDREIWARDEVQSPCVNICMIHPRAQICTGCLRSLEEIASWSSLSNAERARLLRELPTRAAQLKKRRGGRRGRVE